MPRGFSALPPGKVYQLIEPGPVVLLSTARRGRRNVMAMSWHMMLEFEPPLIACVVSGANDSFSALRGTGECVIGVPGAEALDLVVEVGNCSGRETDKFGAFGLTALAGERVGAALIGECFANLECVVKDRRMVSRYNLFVLEVVRAWVKRGWREARMVHHRGYGRFALDGEVVRTASKKR